MGSSPVTATIGPSAERLLRTLSEFVAALREKRGSPPRLLVAFSGGPDSLALLFGLAELSRTAGLTIEAAHFDHALDPESAQRAARARQLSEQLHVPLLSERATSSRLSSPSRGREADARVRRYAFLRQTAQDLGSDCIVTAHHADDQAETVCLRLLFGSGIAGLSAMRTHSHDIARPLLELRRSLLQRVLIEACLEPCDDPSNRDLDLRRNLVRHHLLPSLPPKTHQQLLAVARASRGVSDRIEGKLETLLQSRPPRVPTAIFWRG